jgi:hypothetical protein
MGTVGHFNRWQSSPKNPSDAFNVVQDVDQDGVSEIVIHTPALEALDLLPPSPEMTGKGRNIAQIYKWDGSKYYLWKEVPEQSEE